MHHQIVEKLQTFVIAHRREVGGICMRARGRVCLFTTRMHLLNWI
jgi:hypothetical protein